MSEANEHIYRAPEVAVPHAAHNSNFYNPAFVNNQIEQLVENTVCSRGA